MNFEQELQLLVNKYGLVEVEFSYKKKMILSAQQILNVPSQTATSNNALATNKELVDEISPEEAALAARYTGGPIGKIG